MNIYIEAKCKKKLQCDIKCHAPESQIKNPIANTDKNHNTSRKAAKRQNIAQEKEWVLGPNLEEYVANQIDYSTTHRQFHYYQQEEDTTYKSIE